MTPDIVTFIENISKLGPTAMLIIGVFLILWRVMPVVIPHWRAQTKRDNELAAMMPRMETSLSKMAGHGQASEHLLKEIRDTQVSMNRKLDQLLERD